MKITKRDITDFERCIRAWTSGQPHSKIEKAYNYRKERAESIYDLTRYYDTDNLSWVSSS